LRDKQTLIDVLAHNCMSGAEIWPCNISCLWHFILLRAHFSTHISFLTELKKELTFTWWLVNYFGFKKCWGESSRNNCRKEKQSAII